MKIVVISGSMRKGSRTLDVCNYLLKQLELMGANTSLVDLQEKRLPLYDDSEAMAGNEMWQQIESELESADGLVIASPEWDGMFSAGLHNLFNFVASASDKQSMAHKPVMLVSVSSGLGGAYPLAQMRMTGSKNTHFVVLPESLRFAQVNDVFKDGEILVEGLRDRAEYALKILLEYTAALKPIRSGDTVDLEKFASGI